MGGGAFGKRVKYAHNFYLYTHFFRNSPTGQTPSRIFARDGSNDAVSRKGVPFEG